MKFRYRIFLAAHFLPKLCHFCRGISISLKYLRVDMATDSKEKTHIDRVTEKGNGKIGCTLKIAKTKTKMEAYLKPVRPGAG